MVQLALQLERKGGEERLQRRKWPPDLMKSWLSLEFIPLKDFCLLYLGVIYSFWLLCDSFINIILVCLPINKWLVETCALSFCQASKSFLCSFGCCYELGRSWTMLPRWGFESWTTVSTRKYFSHVHNFLSRWELQSDAYMLSLLQQCPCVMSCFQVIFCVHLVLIVSWVNLGPCSHVKSPA